MAEMRSTSTVGLALVGVDDVPALRVTHLEGIALTSADVATSMVVTVVAGVALVSVLSGPGSGRSGDFFRRTCGDVVPAT